MYKAYILIEDAKRIRKDIFERSKQWIGQRLNETLNEQEWLALLENEGREIVYPKGTLFFKSDYFKFSNGQPCYYPTEVKNFSQWLQLVIDDKAGLSWATWGKNLHDFESELMSAKFKETKVEQVPFEREYFEPRFRSNLVLLTQKLKSCQEEYDKEVSSLIKLNWDVIPKGIHKPPHYRCGDYVAKGETIARSCRVCDKIAEIGKAINKDVFFDERRPDHLKIHKEYYELHGKIWHEMYEYVDADPSRLFLGRVVEKHAA